MRLAVAVAVLAWAGAAAADLYRWVDPESGSVKYSSYPPPWYGDAAKQRRAPRVEHMPARQDKPARSAEAIAAPPTARPAVPATAPPAARAGGSETEDRDVPKNVEARSAEMKSRVESIIKGLRR